MKKNILYLLEMGMDDNNINTDIKNHRVRVINNIDIIYKGVNYNMFFEFTYGKHRNYRKYNKRTGAKLKKSVEEIILIDGLYVDTCYEKTEKNKAGEIRKTSLGNVELEKEFYEEHHEYTKKAILEIVNRYKVGEKFTDICLVETVAAGIIREKGGKRELDILGDNKNFQEEGSHYFRLSEEWSEDHRIIRCYKQEWKPTAGGRRLEDTSFCDVDLVAGKIVK